MDRIKNDHYLIYEQDKSGQWLVERSLVVRGEEV